MCVTALKVENVKIWTNLPPGIGFLAALMLSYILN